MKPDKRIDAYIAKAPEFARPILARIRETVHAACPQCEETVKWGAPTFTYNGKLMVGMAAFKEHCRLILWLGKQIDGANSGQQFHKVSELPSKKELTSQIRQSMKLIDSGAKVMQRSPSKKPALKMPDDFVVALKKNKPAQKHFDSFSASARRDYIEWITEARRADTRSRRIAQAVEWIAEGKQRNWKYM